MTIFYSVAALAAPSTVGLLAERAGSFALPFGILSGLCVAGAMLLSTLPGDARLSAAQVASGPA
jgi:hypothetical protein